METTIHRAFLDANLHHLDASQAFQATLDTLAPNSPLAQLGFRQGDTLWGEKDGRNPDLFHLRAPERVQGYAPIHVMFDDDIDDTWLVFEHLELPTLICYKCFSVNTTDTLRPSKKIKQLSAESSRHMKSCKDCAGRVFMTMLPLELDETPQQSSTLPSPHVPNSDGFELLIDRGMIRVISYAHCDDITAYSMTDPSDIEMLATELIHHQNTGGEGFLFSDHDPEEPSTKVYIVALGNPETPVFDVVRDDAELLSTYVKRFKSSDGVFDICEVVIEDGLL